MLIRLGNGKSTLYGYIDNILIHHLESYKDIINDLSKKPIRYTVNYEISRLYYLFGLFI